MPSFDYRIGVPSIEWDLTSVDGAPVYMLDVSWNYQVIC
jgi:hypothetical protein